MKCAMESSGGLPGVRVAVCCLLTTDHGDASSRKLDGISFLNNIEYNNEGLTVWKSYKVGKGKAMSWSDLRGPNDLRHLRKKTDEIPESRL